MISISLGSQSSEIISATGSVNYWPSADVSINISKVVGVNNLSLGFMLDWHRWQHFIDRPVQRQLARDASFKLIRVFDFRKTTPRLMPCTHWDEPTKTGTWDWANVDTLVQKIFEIGAEPLFCLGWARDNIKNYIPPDMAVDPDTGLPYPESYAAYAKEWVVHFKTLDLPVRYYQIMNEPHFYFGWNPSDTTQLSYYVQLWNASASAMRAENPNILLSQDSITMKRVLDYWLTHGDDVDYLDFHKYDAETVEQYSDAEMFRRAERTQFETYGSFYGIGEAREKWFNARGKWLPAINSESNFNCGWEDGTDPKIQQMVGAIWLALVLRMGILKGLTHNVYFEFCSSKSWQEAHGTGWGFGMTNEDDNQPWYPYYVHKMIGDDLTNGDELIEAESSSDDIRSLGWIHQGVLNILLICIVDEPKTVTLQGISGQLNISWIDNSISYETSSVQTDLINSNETLIISGYTVALLQKPAYP